MRPFHLIPSAALMALVCAPACALFCPQDDCMDVAVEVCATDAETGAPLADAVVQQVSADGSVLESEEGVGNCVAVYGNADEHRLVVSAPGYAAEEFKVELDRDVCGEVVGERRDVALSKEPEKGRVTRGKALEGC